jgi:hypothetical protein
MTGFFDGLAALLVYRNAETDALVYQRMATQVMSFPTDVNVNERLVDAIPLVLEAVNRDAFRATDDVLINISLLLDTLRLRISNFSDPDITGWRESAFEWLTATYRRQRG